MDLARERFCVVDVEGNGATPPEIIELALVEIADLELQTRQMHWFVHPQQPISPAVTRVHGITDEIVANSPEIDDIADDLMVWTSGARIVGHNVRVEVEIISRLVPEWRPVMAVDTMRLTKALFPGLKSYGLEWLGQHFGLVDRATQLSGRNHHSALHDSILAAMLFIELVRSVPVDRRTAAITAADLFNPPQGNLF